jgi:maltose alpha-D-glucosyltransferase / alpha-amylase
MVTDEERDYMYRVYAHDPQARINLGIRRRLAPLLGNNRRKIELMNALLFSLPGHAGALLRRRDRHGRQHLPGRPQRRAHADAVERRPQRRLLAANPQKLYLPVIIDPEYHYEAVNVEAQQQNPSSLLWWMKRLIALRKRTRRSAAARIEFLHPDNRKVSRAKAVPSGTCR